MSRLHRTRTLAVALTLITTACRASGDEGLAQAASLPADAHVVEGEGGAFAFTAADLAGYERGIAREAALVRAAKERGRAAKTPAERGAAAQGEWESATIPGGAQAAGMPVARYRQVRETVHRVLQTLDFQGKIDGPQEIDASSAPPELKRRLASDPFAELAPASAAALRARLDAVVAAYVGYMTLVAVNG